MGRGSRADGGGNKSWSRLGDYPNPPRLFDAWEEVPEPSEPEPGGPDDYYLTAQVLDQDTERPIAGAAVLVESGPNTSEQRRPNRNGSIGCSGLPPTGGKEYVPAPR